MPLLPGTDLRQIAWFWLMLFWVSPAVAQTGMFDVHQLMQALARVETRESAFTEKKILALLNEPLISSGTLRYRRPGYIERMTVVPRQERFVYEGGKITVETAGRQRQISIGDQPALGALVESIRATLAGDEDTLQRHYRLRLSGTRDGWSLEMSPLDSDLLSRIRLIRISGVRDELRQMELFETSDDRTIMTIDAVRR